MFVQFIQCSIIHHSSLVSRNNYNNIGDLCDTVICFNIYISPFPPSLVQLSTPLTFFICFPFDIVCYGNGNGKGKVYSIASFFFVRFVKIFIRKSTLEIFFCPVVSSSSFATIDANVRYYLCTLLFVDNLDPYMYVVFLVTFWFCEPAQKEKRECEERKKNISLDLVCMRTKPHDSTIKLNVS